MRSRKMLASIRSAVAASPGRTSAKTDSIRSSVLALGRSRGAEPTIGACLLPLNASAGVKTRKRRRRRRNLHRLFGRERTRELRQMELPPAARALVVPAVGSTRRVEQEQHFLG